MKYIIIPTYIRECGTYDLIHRLLSFDEENYILLIDDYCGGWDKGHDFSPEFAQRVKVLEGNRALYWGGAINRGLSGLESIKPDNDDIVVFMNHDIVVDEANYRSFIKAIRETRAIVHPALVNEHGKEISSGGRILCHIPYITRSSLRYRLKRIRVDYASARMLGTIYSNIRKIGMIDRRLPHYGGDNEYIYRARKLGIDCYIHSDIQCKVDEKNSGLKVNNIKNSSQLLESFRSIKSPNCIKYKYRFYRLAFGSSLVAGILVVQSIFTVIGKTLYFIYRKRTVE